MLLYNSFLGNKLPVKNCNELCTSSMNGLVKRELFLLQSCAFFSTAVLFANYSNSSHPNVNSGFLWLFVALNLCVVFHWMFSFCLRRDSCPFCFKIQLFNSIGAPKWNGEQNQPDDTKHID